MYKVYNKTSHIIRGNFFEGGNNLKRSKTLSFRIRRRRPEEPHDHKNICSTKSFIWIFEPRASLLIHCLYLIDFFLCFSLNDGTTKSEAWACVCAEESIEIYIFIIKIPVGFKQFVFIVVVVRAYSTLSIEYKIPYSSCGRTYDNFKHTHLTLAPNTQARVHTHTPKMEFKTVC